MDDVTTITAGVPKTLTEAAIDAASRGWAVLPLVPRDKVPAIKGGFKAATDDVDQVRSWWDGYPDRNIGIACGTPSGGLVVIDIDVDDTKGEDGMVTLRAWEAEHGELPETVTAVTGRGGLHLYYRCNTPISCSVNSELGIDVRAEGGYCVLPPSVHPNGIRYEWETPPGEIPVANADDNVYAFLEHAQGERKRKRFVLPEHVPAGERNDTLFRYAASLHEQGFDDIYMRIALDQANSARCTPPLTDAEVEGIVTSVTERYEKGARKANSTASSGRKYFRKLDRNGHPTGPVLHNVVAHELIDAHGACFVDGAPAIWAVDHYETGWIGIDSAVIDLVDDSKIAERREVRNYLVTKAPKIEASPPELIAFANGVFNLNAGLRPASPDDVITNVIPHAYIEDAYDVVADAFLDSVSSGDATVRANLEEVMGLCLYRSNDFGICPVLVGSGANGKSTYLKALRNMLGNDNVSALDAGQIGKTFQATQLVGKLANLGDDISNGHLSGDDLAVFKKVVTGEWIYTDVKNGDGFHFHPFCTLVFSCNEFPRLGDVTEGMMRRLFPIPFNARFTRNDPDFDPHLEEKLREEPAACYLARLAVEGLMRVIANNGLTPNAASDEIVNEVRTENDSVLAWVEDSGVSPKAFDGLVILDCHESYKEWCADAGLMACSRTTFTRRMKAAYSLGNNGRLVPYADGKRMMRCFQYRGDVNDKH